MGEFPKNPIENSSDEEKSMKDLIERKGLLLDKIKGLYGKELLELAKNTHILAHDEFMYADNTDDVNKLLGRFAEDIKLRNESELSFMESQLRQVMEKAQKEKEERKSRFNKLFKK